MNIINKILFIALFFQPLLRIDAQWQKTNGPYGGTGLVSIVSNGTNLFGAASDSIYISRDNGLNWKSLYEGLPYNPEAPGIRTFFCMGSNGGSVFAGTFAGVYRTTNDGASWESINGNLEPNIRITSFGFLDTVIFVGTQTMDSSGIFRSTDNGISWSCVSSFHGNWTVNSFIAYNDFIFAGAHGGGLFRSSDSGKTWYHLDSSGIGNFITGMIIKNNKLYVGSDGVYRSEDGVNWSKISTYNFQTFTSIGDYLLTGDGYGVGVLLSKDEGKSWTAKNNGFIDDYPPSISASYLASFNDNLFATTPQGLFISMDTAKTWSIVNIRSIETVAYSIISDNGTLYAGTDAGFFRSTNNGENWIAANSGLSSYIVYCIAIQGSDLFAGTSNGLFHSSDGGNSWLPVNGLDRSNIIRAITIQDSDIFAVGSKTIFKSTNYGENWTPLNLGATFYKSNSMIVDGENIIAGGISGIFKSTDSGLNWKQSNTGLSDKHITALLSMGDKLYAGTYLHGVFSSINNGDSWSSLPFYKLSNQAVHSLAGYNNDMLIVGTDYGPLVYSLKDSTLAADYKAGLPSIISIYSLTTKDSFIFAGTYGNGIWSRPLHELITSVDNWDNQSSLDYYLCQNYPNPFNPSTTIQYRLSANSFVSLKVYNILGKEVTTLVNERKPAGNYTLEFNAENLPSGVYFYSIITAEFNQTRKMLLMK